MRTISGPLATEFAKSITQIGYLVKWYMSPALQWSNVGAVTWDAMVFVDFSFSIEGLAFDADRESECTIVAQNLDNAIAAQFLTAFMSDVTVDIWQFSPSALAVGDPVKLASFVVGDCDIGLDRVRVRLLAQSSLDAFSPRRRIDPANGFNFALPEGSQIAWENEIYFAEASRG